MTNKTTAEVMDELFDYLGDDRWDLGELIVDTCDGANIMNPHTKELLKQLFASMPESDNLTTEDIARYIREVGTPYAVDIAHDIHSAK